MGQKAPGGDEFVILLHDLSSFDNARAVATKIIVAMKSGFRIAGQVLG